jgi:hypothetical protein
MSGKLKFSLPQPCSERNEEPVLTSDQRLPPDIKQLIEVVMRFFEKRKRHPILLTSSDDYDRLLKKWNEVDTSSLQCLADQIRQRVSPRS